MSQTCRAAVFIFTAFLRSLKNPRPMPKSIFRRLSVLIFFVASSAHALVGQIILPKDPNIVRFADVELTKNDARFSEYVLFQKAGGPKHSRQTTTCTVGDGFVSVHSRIDNGTAGSGITYKIDYTLVDDPDQTVISFKTRSEPPVTYQEGLFGKFQVPNLSEANALTEVLTGTIKYKFEVDSNFPPESIKANFKRLANGSIEIGTSKVEFKYSVSPYRAGSKATITAFLDAPPPGVDGNVDFRKLIELLKSGIQAVVNN